MLLCACGRAFVQMKLWQTARLVSDLRHKEGSHQRLLETAERLLTEFEEDEEVTFDDWERVAACVRAMAYLRDDNGALVRDIARTLKRLLWSHGGGDNEKDNPADEHYNDSADDHTSNPADDHTSDPVDEHTNEQDPPSPSSSFLLSAVCRAPVPSHSAPSISCRPRWRLSDAETRTTRSSTRSLRSSCPLS